MVRIHELMTEYIVDLDLPFSTFDSDYIRGIPMFIDPKLAEQLATGKTTMKTNLEKMHFVRRDNIEKGFRGALTKVHINFDL